MRFLTSRGRSRTSKPATVAVPALGGRKQVSMRMVVVLPAPLGPRNPTIWPFSTENEMWSTAVVRAYLLVRSETLIIVICWQRQECRADRMWEHGDMFILRTTACVCQKAGLQASATRCQMYVPHGRVQTPKIEPRRLARKPEA